MKKHPTDTDATTRIFSVRPDLNSEEALANASEILASASAMANEQAFASNGSQRLQTFGLEQLIEDARLLVDTVLEDTFSTTTKTT